VRGRSPFRWDLMRGRSPFRWNLMRGAPTEEQLALSIERYPLIRQVFDLAADCGTPIYLVGGTVRDLALGRDTHDLDFATPGNGLALARYVADRLGGAYVPLDHERKTGRVVLRSEHLDIASLRGDDLAADLRGRDFTINSMALSRISDGAWKLHDPAGGRRDLANGVLRVTSSSSLTVDPLRTLRAVRFQAQFGYTIEPHTRNYVQETAPLLARVSPERVRDEWFRILQQNGAAEAVSELHHLGLLPIIAPPVDPAEGASQDTPERIARFHHALDSVRALERLWTALQSERAGHHKLIPDALHVLGPQIRQRYEAHICDERTYLALLKCAALLHNPGQAPVGHPEVQAAEIAAGLGRRWRCSSREVDLLHTVVRYHRLAGEIIGKLSPDRRTIHRYYREAGEYGIDAVLVSLAATLAQAGDSFLSGWARQAEAAAQLLTPCLEGQTDLLAPPPLLSGNDLMELLQLPPGPQIGELLEGLCEEQAAGDIRTREEALAWVRTRAASS
jgi:tRNA nucleotidyltransferase/poly(A) polymerase